MKILLSNTGVYSATYAAYCIAHGKLINPVNAMLNISQWPNTALLLLLMYVLLLVHQVVLTIRLHTLQGYMPFNFYEREQLAADKYKIKVGIIACIWAKYFALLMVVVLSII